MAPSEIKSVGILVDGNTVQQWAHRAVTRMVQDHSVSIDLIVQNDTTTKSKKKTNRLLNISAWNIYRAFERRLYNIPEYKKQIPLEDITWATNTECVYAQVEETDSLGSELPSDIIEKLSELDVCIRFGFGIIVGEALNAPKYGILSFHHGDITQYRGRPGGFWEFVHNERVAGVTLQQLTESLDGGKIIVLKKVPIKNTNNWRDVQAIMYEASEPMLSSAIHKYNQGISPETPDTLGELQTNPNLIDILRYYRRVVQSRVEYK